MVQGMEELMANVQALRAKGRRAQDRALNSMADKFSETLEENINTGMQHGNEIHLKEDVKAGKPRRHQGVLEVKVGLAGSASRGELPAWYAHFVDTGSIKKAPEFFSERSRQQATPELKEILEDQFKEELGS